MFYETKGGDETFNTDIMLLVCNTMYFTGDICSVI